MLAEKFQKGIEALGMNRLEHPLFYHAPVAIRFEIGGGVPVYQERGQINPAYLNGAYSRAQTIYETLPEKPHLLRIDIHPDERNAEELIQTICQHTGLPAPHETKAEVVEDDGERFDQIALYWDLSKFHFSEKPLILEILRGDIGGCNLFVSSVFLLADAPVLYYLYDDRGLDVLGGTREILLPLYQKFHGWILAYDRAQIDAVFMADTTRLDVKI